MNLTNVGLVVSPFILRWKDLDYSIRLATCFHTGILFGLFDLEDEGDIFLRNVGCLSNGLQNVMSVNIWIKFIMDMMPLESTTNSLILISSNQ